MEVVEASFMSMAMAARAFTIDSRLGGQCKGESVMAVQRRRGEGVNCSESGCARGEPAGDDGNVTCSIAGRFLHHKRAASRKMGRERGLTGDKASAALLRLDDEEIKGWLRRRKRGLVERDKGANKGYKGEGAVDVVSKVINREGGDEMEPDVVEGGELDDDEGQGRNAQRPSTL